MKNFKLVVKVVFYLLICVILLVLMLQNSQMVDFKFLGVTFSSPLVLILLIALIVGYVIGLSTLFFFSRREDRSRKGEKSIEKNDKK